MEYCIPPAFSIVVLYLILIKKSAIDMIKYFILFFHWVRLLGEIGNIG